MGVVLIIIVYFTDFNGHSETQTYCTDHFLAGDCNDNYRGLPPNANSDQRLSPYLLTFHLPIYCQSSVPVETAPQGRVSSTERVRGACRVQPAIGS